MKITKGRLVVKFLGAPVWIHGEAPTSLRGKVRRWRSHRKWIRDYVVPNLSLWDRALMHLRVIGRVPSWNAF